MKYLKFQNGKENIKMKIKIIDNTNLKQYGIKLTKMPPWEADYIEEVTKGKIKAFR